MIVLVTGAAGFIGSSLTLRLLRDGHHVVGVDNLSPYYDVSLKEARLSLLMQQPEFVFERLDLAERDGVARLFAARRFEVVVHLAGQAGVRYSLENPYAYVDANLVAFVNVLEQSRRTGIGHFVFASSSSVYGANQRLPFSEHDAVDHPISLYAATKRANELLAHSYAHLFGLPCTGLRFFTVYGPWMRPDMAIHTFAEGIMEGRPIRVHNSGDMQRDFTFIDDVVDGVVRLMTRPPQPDPGWKGDTQDPARGSAPFRLYNIGNQDPVDLMRVIRLLEQALGRKAVLEFLPMQPGDMYATAADITDIHAAVGFAPATPIETGIARFAEWFLDYAGGGRDQSRAVSTSTRRK